MINKLCRSFSLKGPFVQKVRFLCLSVLYKHGRVHVGGACSGLWQLTNQRGLGFSGGGVIKRQALKHRVCCSQRCYSDIQHVKIKACRLILLDIQNNNIHLKIRTIWDFRRAAAQFKGCVIKFNLKLMLMWSTGLHEGSHSIYTHTHTHQLNNTNAHQQTHTHTHTRHPKKMQKPI